MSKCKFAISVWVVLLCSYLSSMAQTVTFQSPIPWITLRSQTITVKTLLDTADLKSRPITFTLNKHEKKKKTVLATKQIKTKESSVDFEFFKMNQPLLGGYDYLSIEWKVPPTVDTLKDDRKGYIEPFGIVVLDTNKAPTTVACKKTGGAVDIESLSKLLTEKDFYTAGALSFAATWTEQSLGILCKNVSSIQTIIMGIDGKNGKNAFLAFADRIITYFPANDSLNAVYPRRSLVHDTGIKYDFKPWIHEIKKEKKESMLLVQIPWDNLGLVANDERVIGFAVFTVGNDKKSSAFPKNAAQQIPGTWADLQLKKE